MTAIFGSRDPVLPAFWSERFEQHFTPWDRAGAPVQLLAFIAAAPAPLVTFIPGCGIGHEVASLAAAGWDVCAIDFSPAAVTAAQAMLGQYSRHVVQADFFSFVPPRPVELIYERAFLCALPPSLWPQVLARYAALLPPGGLLVGFFFYADAPHGPPFGADPVAFAARMAPHFSLCEDHPVPDSVPAFSGRERWQVWQRH